MNQQRAESQTAALTENLRCTRQLLCAAGISTRMKTASATPLAPGTPVVTPILQRDRGFERFDLGRGPCLNRPHRCVSSRTLARPDAFPLPPTSVRSTVYIDHLSGYLACMCEEQHG